MKHKTPAATSLGGLHKLPVEIASECSSYKNIYRIDPHEPYKAVSYTHLTLPTNREV